ncbi:glycoside hydrolase family 65 protein [Salisediminibacterium halotolerans]|uniref:glycoside hydrolase family 65 protein n=1 Tax=Salisediminibacterium halotolerans TaxID=517425 RepID=UPI000EAE8089|nr:glycoside hydrolase family 65 protein [Salisediminibacterium halotolerans]RLJ77869.1 maltose phosphorylase [Actinophytocola xinjiangensis]RPE88793.1 maltose phosphorylase [Salisediminibacterium halotolerans]TWG36846.1 maltose phosphorylase [Salisediminibacterium halotolerans]GEL07983.1 maltose phosphorylase [Salisediminibacterium halotolerans]
MKPYLKEHPWSIIEDSFDKNYHQISESIFSIGNGHMGQRANFEETYSGESLQGSYMAGVYYPDKTRVGWWKNGYPEYFAKVLNATNWIGLSFKIDGEELDLNKADVKSFYRELNMKEGYLTRKFTAELSAGKVVEVEATRFVSIVNKEIGAIEYKLTPVNFSATVQVCSYLDGDIKNEDANYDEKFWDPVHVSAEDERTSVTVKTKKLDFYYCAMQETHIYQGDERQTGSVVNNETEKYSDVTFELELNENTPMTVYKYAANVTNRDHDISELEKAAALSLDQAVQKGFTQLKTEQSQQWEKKWLDSDIVIEGDVSAQQGIRFNIFQLNQTYTGEDERLNIGPKGFTGEKYGGSTYWDTEAYCLPFYLATSEQRIPRNLLIYRYNHLEKAKENAAKLGFSKGALYPMVTMNGEESHNEWEITFEEIHRNGAIAYAIYNYVNYTGDKSYLGEYGIEVLTEISRFWEDRVHYVEHKGYVMIGVTGPNEYENNVHNNWYTNRIAAWTLEYTLNVLDYLKDSDPDLYKKWVAKLAIKEEETSKWADIIHRMYYPYDEQRGVFLQQDLFLDKELMPVAELDDRHLPINQNWSWDRILRSCFIKQADVLQGLYFLNNEFDMDTKKRNFDFYEPMTVHESSLSPCVHAILACELGYKEKAYEMYLRTARLDLDNYNNDTEDGCHITSMAGTWMSVVEGFGGMKIKNDQLILNPFIPGNWTSYSFKIVFRHARLRVQIDQKHIDVTNESDVAVDAVIHGEQFRIEGKSSVSLDH